MTSILDRITKIKDEAPRITLYGKQGIGKSTLASQFPNPLFLLTEKNAVKDSNALTMQNFEDIWQTAKELVEMGEKLEFKTIIVDTISGLDKMITDYILSKETKATTLAASCGGYGAGYSKAAMLHWALKEKLEELQKFGIVIIYIGHLTTKTHKSPDAEDYDIYTIVACHDKVRDVYINDSDAVLFCRQKSFFSETESGRSLIKSTDQRIIVTNTNEVNVSKNRYNMPAEIPMSFSELAKHIPFYQNEEKS